MAVATERQFPRKGNWWKLPYKLPANSIVSLQGYVKFIGPLELKAALWTWRYMVPLQLFELKIRFDRNPCRLGTEFAGFSMTKILLFRADLVLLLCNFQRHVSNKRAEVSLQEGTGILGHMEVNRFWFQVGSLLNGSWKANSAKGICLY